jgi:cellulose synthase operon protein C
VVERAPADPLEKARRIYRWILDNVEEGPELDGRRVVMGKRGNRWRGFVELCRALEIPVHYGVARNQLLPVPAGPFEQALQYSEPVLVVGEGKSQTWLALGDKHAPFGYLPPEIRETTAYVLDREPATKVAVVATGPTDRFDIQGEGVLDPSGSAKLQLTQRFDGKLAIVLRDVLSQAPESQLRAFIEGRLIGQALQGAQLISFEFSNRDDADKPLILVARLLVPRFAQQHPTGLILSPPFAASLRTLASLPARETPIVLGDPSEHQIRLRIKLPSGARVAALPAARTYTHGKLEVVVRDRVDGETLILDRYTKIPVGRIAVEDYPAFASFARTAGDALLTQIRVDLGASKTR